MENDIKFEIRVLFVRLFFWGFFIYRKIEWPFKTYGFFFIYQN